jgi:cyclomaltodextrinase / maltogenic alpha-amylase / neopullulanase
MKSLISTPEWVKDAVFYQIFPDRFAKSDRVKKPRLLQPWGSQPTDHGYQGGDLLGVVEHLDHLGDLGVNAIYFTPIFQSASNHRYHTHDYYQVDPLLGGNAAFRTLMDEAHRRKIKVVIDGVFNHAGRGFFPFNDILENGAESPWLDWFTIEKWPLSPYDVKKPANYVSWWGNRALPRLNTDNSDVREYIMRVAEFWLREYGIDGWRLDVPMEITAPGFWQEFRQRVKAVNPEAYIVGEVWTDARQWLQGDQFDGVMNYIFAGAAIAFTGGSRVSEAQVKGKAYAPYPGIDAPQFGRRIQDLLAMYDWQITQAQLNVLDTHDTARLLAIARGDKATLRLATLLQMTFPGAPSVYYGDEICIRGSMDYDQPMRDVDSRWAFPWHDRSSWDLDMLAAFRRLIAMRHAHSALRHGRFAQVLAEDECYAFVRQDESETLLVALNAGTSPCAVTAPVSGYFADGQQLWPVVGSVDSGPVQRGRISLRLPARAGVVLGP